VGKSCFTNVRWKNSKENSNIQPKRKKRYRKSAVKMEGPVYSSRGLNGPSMALSLKKKKMMMMMYILIFNFLERGRDNRF
jgi:hypothetical protein